MSTQLTRVLSPTFALAIAAGLALTACNKGEEPKSAAVVAASAATPSADIAWAKAALERNPELEVLAVDPQTGVVTVKNRSTGETEAVKASELIAVPPSRLRAMQMADAPPPEVDPAPEQSATAPETGATTASSGQTRGRLHDRSQRRPDPRERARCEHRQLGHERFGQQRRRARDAAPSIHSSAKADARCSWTIATSTSTATPSRCAAAARCSSPTAISWHRAPASSCRTRRSTFRTATSKAPTPRSRPKTAQRCSCAARRSRVFHAAPSRRRCRTRAAIAGASFLVRATRTACRRSACRSPRPSAGGTCAGRDPENPPRRARGSRRPSGRPARARTDCAASARRPASETP